MILIMILLTVTVAITIMIAELPSGAPLASWEIKGNP